MEWRFSLIDRNGLRTVIDEPVGWDNFSIRLKRHPQRHGSFRSLQGNNFEFNGIAGQLLKGEHDVYGIRGDYKLLIESRCGFSWSEFFIGTISFDTYSYNCGARCYVKVDIEQTGPQVAFINRFDQKVEVGRALGFDQTTALTEYEKLTRTIQLPSKAILLRSSALNTLTQEYDISGDSGWYPTVAQTGLCSGSINPMFNNIEINSIQDFTPDAIMDFYNYSNASEYTPELIYNNPEKDLKCVTVGFDVDFRVKGTFKNLGAGSGSHTLYLVLKKGFNTFNSGATTVASWEISSNANGAASYPFDISHVGSVTLVPGQKLWLSFFLAYVKNTNYTTDVRMEIESVSYFKASVISKCDPTDSKVYLINETSSRITEAITDNKLKVYSEYLGRLDSQPYSLAANGCGSLRSVTMGLDIRRSKLSDGSDPKLFLSMQDIFNHLAATDNIGIGFEGKDKVRIENWKWFYKPIRVLRCEDIDNIKTTLKPEEHFSVFKVGYDKWETEDFNGQDEILTKREYRLPITQVQNTLDQLSKILGSGYAIETTRRKSGEDKDWRYDNDVFAICLQNVCRRMAAFSTIAGAISVPYTPFFVTGHQIQVTGTALNDGVYTISSLVHAYGTIIIYVVEPLVNEDVLATFEDITSQQYEVEIENVDSGANLLDPDTVYNFRISPVRMAMKWFDRLSSIFRTVTNADKLIFSSGEGNYLAEGKLKYPFCRLEAGVIKENDDIAKNKFEDEEDALPIVFADRVEYRYPLGAGDFKLISLNPYGLIKYKSNCEDGEGWIDELIYYPNDGVANFSLIPMHADSPQEIVDGIITEDGQFILTEDGQNIIPE